jgi:hypothetical protein
MQEAVEPVGTVETVVLLERPGSTRELAVRAQPKSGWAVLVVWEAPEVPVVGRGCSVCLVRTACLVRTVPMERSAARVNRGSREGTAVLVIRELMDHPVRPGPTA